MAITTFAAIDVGSYHICMDIYEIAPRSGIHLVDEIKSRLEIGRDTYATGKISYESTQQLCTILLDFSRIMKEYKVDAYRACATSTLQEARNVWIVLDHVYQTTGINVEILSNSEQRFYGYKSLASNDALFTQTIQKGTAIIEIGGGNVQISLFDKDALVTTQNFKMGSLRIREKIASMEDATSQYEKLIEELVHNDVLTFKKFHLKDRKIDHIILLGDTFMETLLRNRSDERSLVSRKAFMEVYRQILDRSPEQAAVELGVSLEFAKILMPTLVICRVFVDVMEADSLWVPGTQLNEGISYDYAQKNKLIKSTHNFENDILVSAKNIAKRYMSNKNHTQAVEQAALAIFNGMKKVHGMGNREKLMLQIAAILHDCGKYISLRKYSECSYAIIMSTEIIGLSHVEREVIANVVRFNGIPFQYYGEADSKSTIDRETYMLMGKLTAIIRVAEALDRSHKQKAKEIKAVVKDKELIITVDTEEDLTLEEGMLNEKAEFFEEVFSIRPRLRRKIRR